MTLGLDAPSRRRPVVTRHQLGAASVLYVALLASNAPSPLYVIYQEQWHFSSLMVTAIFATYAMAVLVALVSFGRLSDRVGRKQVLMPATLLLAVSAVAFLLADGVGWLLVARAVQGLATGMLAGAVTATLVELDPEGDHRRASLINTVSFVSGAASGPLLFGLCAQYLPAPTILPFVIEIGLIALAVPALIGLPETVPALGPGQAPPAMFTRPTVPAALRRSFAVAALVLGVCWSVGALYASLGSSIEAQLLHVGSHAAAGALLFGFNVLGGISQIGLRRWSPRRSMGAGVVSLGVGIASVWAALAASSTLLFVAGTVAVGLGGGVAFMGSLTLINEIAPPRQRAGIISAYNMIGYVALAVPVVAVGFLSGAWGLLPATGVFAAAVVLVAAIAVVAVNAHPRDALAHLSARERADLGLAPGICAILNG